jgi:hypothetical protein
MGSLTPGATYVYERDNGTIYAREFGSNPSTRKEIGYHYDSRTGDGRPLHDHIMDSKMWGEIRRAARTNKVLQDALDRVILLYHLSKDHGKE